jgi:hypothetical protein
VGRINPAPTSGGVIINPATGSFDVCWPNKPSLLESTVADVLFQPSQGAQVCTCRKSVQYCG